MVQSKLYKEADLAWQRDNWLRIHRPMSTRELDAVQGDWETYFAKLPYIRIIKAGQTYGSDHLITFRCRCKLGKAHMEMVQADLERLWAKVVGDGMESLYSFRATSLGFEMQFAGLAKNNSVLSGQIVIETLES